MQLQKLTTKKFRGFVAFMFAERDQFHPGQIICEFEVRDAMNM